MLLRVEDDAGKQGYVVPAQFRNHQAWTLTYIPIFFRSFSYSTWRDVRQHQQCHLQWLLCKVSLAELLQHGVMKLCREIQKKNSRINGQHVCVAVALGHSRKASFVLEEGPWLLKKAENIGVRTFSSKHISPFRRWGSLMALWIVGGFCHLKAR